MMEPAFDYDQTMPNNLTFPSGDAAAVVGFESENAEGTVAVVWCATNMGNQPVPLRVECTFGRGFSGVLMLGGAGRVCEDGKERARTALERLGWSAPARKIIISVSPGDAKIDSSHLDLALCVALAAAMGEKNWVIKTHEWLFAAEIGLNGELRPVSGIVSWATVALQSGLKGIVVAKENLPELECLSTIHRDLNDKTGRLFDFAGFATLAEVMAWLSQGNLLAAEVSTEEGHPEKNLSFDDMDLSKEQELLVTVAAAGMHSLLLRGSPGTGKSMLASRLTSILPRMNVDDHLESLRIHSSAKKQVPRTIIQGIPPFRSPHHFTSLSAMIGTATCPGELSLASGGVLFLDELPEFRRDVLEGLREPLDSGMVAVSRVGTSATWVAKVLLVAAANNCPCGWSASKRRRCNCPPSRIQSYRNRLSGPLLDRIDLHVNMEEPTNQLATLFAATISREGQTARIQERVFKAREMARSRSAVTGVELNRDVPSAQILETFGLPRDDVLTMIQKIIPSHASARSLVRCLRVARTVADVFGREMVLAEDIERAWGWQAWSAAKQRGEILPL